MINPWWISYPRNGLSKTTRGFKLPLQKKFAAKKNPPCIVGLCPGLKRGGVYVRVNAYFFCARKQLALFFFFSHDESQSISKFFENIEMFSTFRSFARRSHRAARAKNKIFLHVEIKKSRQIPADEENRSCESCTYSVPTCATESLTLRSWVLIGSQTPPGLGNH